MQRSLTTCQGDPLADQILYMEYNRGLVHHDLQAPAQVKTSFDELPLKVACSIHRLCSFNH